MDFSFPNGLNGKVHATHDISSSRGKEFVDVVRKEDHIFLSHSFKTADAITTAIESDDGEPVGRGQGFYQETHGFLHQFDLLSIHGATDIYDTDEIDTGSGASTC